MCGWATCGSCVRVVETGTIFIVGLCRVVGPGTTALLWAAIAARATENAIGGFDESAIVAGSQRIERRHTGEERRIWVIKARKTKARRKCKNRPSSARRTNARRRKSSRVGLGDRPRPSPLTEPYVRDRIRLLFQVISSARRQDSCFNFGQIEKAQLVKPRIGHGPTGQVTPRTPPASHTHFDEVARITQLPQAAMQA